MRAGGSQGSSELAVLVVFALSLWEEQQRSPQSISCLQPCLCTSARSREYARALVTRNPTDVPEALQDEFCLPSQSSKPGEVPQAPAELPKEHRLANQLYGALCAR